MEKFKKLWFVNLLIIEYQYVRIYTLKYKRMGMSIWVWMIKKNWMMN